MTYFMTAPCRRLVWPEAHRLHHHVGAGCRVLDIARLATSIARAGPAIGKILSTGDVEAGHASLDLRV
ncbi:hypothetical protein [Actinocatenispora thailandica]|uniref:hypothetical protein n=1 Tax=Actinocatenispora thailandica TaxID=227318 RepID=UPI0019521DFE|nr:hypothetical protein [Actinocatenispora thailandica]